MKKINFRKTLFAAVLLFQLNAIAAFGQTVVKGSVKDNTGKPISGVVVTDGAHFNTTDAEGNYVLNTDPTRYPMVYISTPAAYELPSKEGVADGFYQYLDAGKSENQCDFVLTKRQKPVDEFVYIVLSDPQVRNEKQLDRFRTETVPETDCRLTKELRNRRHGTGGSGVGCHEPVRSLPASGVQLRNDDVPTDGKPRLQPALQIYNADGSSGGWLWGTELLSVIRPG